MKKLTLQDQLKEKRESAIRAFMEHVSPTVKDLHKEGKRTITTAAYSMMRLNSYERQLIYPLLDDMALIKVVKHCLEQAGAEFEEYRLASKPLPSTYNEALKEVHIHELLRRFGELAFRSQKLANLMPSNHMLADYMDNIDDAKKREAYGDLSNIAYKLVNIVAALSHIAFGNDSEPQCEHEGQAGRVCGECGQLIG